MVTYRKPSLVIWMVYCGYDHNGTPDYCSDFPQLLQNFAPPSFFVPHSGQNVSVAMDTAGTGVPQETQNLTPAAIVEPHLEQVADDAGTFCAEEVTARFVELKTTSVIASRFLAATTIKPMSGKRPRKRKNQPYRLA